MFIAILSWIIGVLLVAASVLTGVGACIERRDSLCMAGCSDLPYVVAFAVLGIFGAAVSISISQISKPRSSYIKWMIVAGGAIFLAASITSIFFFGTVLTLVYIVSALIVITMIAWSVDRPVLS